MKLFFSIYNDLRRKIHNFRVFSWKIWNCHKKSQNILEKEKFAKIILPSQIIDPNSSWKNFRAANTMSAAATGALLREHFYGELRGQKRVSWNWKNSSREEVAVIFEIWKGEKAGDDAFRCQQQQWRREGRVKIRRNLHFVVTDILEPKWPINRTIFSPLYKQQEKRPWKKKNNFWKAIYNEPTEFSSALSFVFCVAWALSSFSYDISI